MMLRQLARPLIRRGLHTTSNSSRQQSWRGAHLAFAASGAASALLAWQLHSNPIMLDADTTAHSSPKATKEHPLSAKTASKPAVLESTVTEHSHPKDHPIESAETATTETVATPSSSSKSTPAKKPKSEFVDEHEHDHDHSDPAHKHDHDHDHDHSTEGSEGSEEASEEGGFQGGAYNPETGEINWDCPCLGGMAHGPCGPQFREAFACFIHSEEDPKGIDCVEKFKGMQECFREHPEVYAEEIMDDDEEDDAAPAAAGADASAPSDGELAEARQAAAEGGSDWTAPTDSKPTTATGKEPHTSASGTA